MNLVRNTLYSSVGLMALVIPRPIATTVAFAPEAGSSLTKRFKLVNVTEIDSMDMTMNGEPAPMTPEIESTTTETREIVIKDTYVSVADGAPGKLERTYVELSRTVDSPVEMTMMGTDVSADMHATGTSDLVGKTVIFTRDADAGGYEKSFGDEGGDEDLLEGLIEDMDLRALLPDGDVDEGDSWDVELDSILDLMYAGGNLGFDMESDGDDPLQGMPDPADEPDPRELFGEFEGDATATFEGVREADGKKIAVIKLSIDVTNESDVSDVYSEQLEKNAPDGMEMTIDRAEMVFTFEGGGELLWDLDGGQLISMEVKGDGTTEIDQEMAIEMGETINLEQRIEMSGTTEISVTTE